MDINVNVTVEFGAKTLALLAGLTNNQGITNPAPATPVEEKEIKTTRGGAAGGKAGTTAKDEPKAAPNFADLGEEEQLEAIKVEVTKQTKRGKSADIKALLANFGVARVSELKDNPENIIAFMDFVQRYGKGETVEQLTSLD